MHCLSNILASGTPADNPPRPENPEDPAARLGRQCCKFEFESKLNQDNMARPNAANKRKVTAAKSKNEEDKEESKEINSDDDYFVLSDRSDKDQSEGETKEPLNEGGDPKSDTSGFEFENL